MIFNSLNEYKRYRRKRILNTQTFTDFINDRNEQKFCQECEKDFSFRTEKYFEREATKNFRPKRNTNGKRWFRASKRGKASKPPNETMKSVCTRARVSMHMHMMTTNWLPAHGNWGIKNVRLFRRLWLIVWLFGSSNADQGRKPDWVNDEWTSLFHVSFKLSFFPWKLNGFLVTKEIGIFKVLYICEQFLLDVPKQI